MRTLIIPDIHLGKGLNIGKDSSGIGMNSRIIDQKVLLDFAKQVAIEEKVTSITLLGDIWQETNPKPAVVYVFLDWLLSCTNNDIKVNIIHGNHDYVRSGSNKISMLDCIDISKIKNCRIFNSIETILEDNVAITYVPFTDRRQLEANTINEAIDKLSLIIKSSADKFESKCNILFGHLALENSIWIGDEIADDTNEIFCPLKMFNEFDFVFMGHIHNPQILQQKPFIAHVGSLDRTAFTGPDSGDKALLLFDSTPGTVDKIKLPCRNLCDFTIIIPKDVKDETQFIIDEISKEKSRLNDSIVRIKVEGSSAETNYVDKNHIYSALSKLGVFHVSSLNETRYNQQVLTKNIDITEGMDHFSAVDKFVGIMKEDNEFKLKVSKMCKSIIQTVKEAI
jgi:DNA repair exonuclease SbcCD nuclease subunit